MHPYIAESLQPKPINADIERTGNRTRSTGGNISFPKTRDNRTAQMKELLEAKDAGKLRELKRGSYHLARPSISHIGGREPFTFPTVAKRYTNQFGSDKSEYWQEQTLLVQAR